MAMLFNGSILKYQIGATITLDVQFRTSADVGVTGLTPVLRVQRTSDSKWLKNDGTWTASPSTEYTLSEHDLTNYPGRYTRSWTPPSQADTYRVRYYSGTGGSGTPEDTYYDLIIEVLQSDPLLGVTVSPYASQADAELGVTDVEVQRGSSGTIVWTITDSAGAAINLSTSAIKLVLSSPATPTTTAYTITEVLNAYGVLSVGGASSNQVTLDYEDDLTASAATYEYDLWRVDEPTGYNTLLAQGEFKIAVANIG